ncbi:MAG: hypothetical protein WCP57_01610 [Bacteroidota bacterium]
MKIIKNILHGFVIISALLLFFYALTSKIAIATHLCSAITVGLLLYILMILSNSSKQHSNEKSRNL